MAKNSGSDGTFSPIIFDNFSGGLVSPLDREPDSLDLSESPDLNNVDFDGRSSFKPRGGSELLGDRNTNPGAYDRGDVFFRPIIGDQIAVIQDGTILKYLNKNTNTWIALMEYTAAAGAKVGFASYTSATDTEDHLYFGDGVSALTQWTGGNTRLNGALSGGESTIPVDSTKGFPSAGAFAIGATDISYTGVTDTTFTGCSGTPAAADRSVVTDIPQAVPAEPPPGDSPPPTTATPIGNILWVWNSQLFVANQKQYYFASDIDDFTQWTPVSGSLAHSKGFSDGSVRGIKSKDDKLIIYLDNGVKYMSYDFSSDLTGVEISIADVEASPSVGCISQIAIAQTDGALFHVSLDGVIRSLVRSPNSSLIDINSISMNIRNALATYVLDNASAAFFRNKMYFAVASGKSGINDTVFVFDFKYAAQNKTKEAWTKYSLYVNDWFVYNGALHYLSSAQPNVFRLFTSATDGSVLLTDDGAAIPFYYFLPQLDFGMPNKKFRLKKVVSRGFISETAEIEYDALFDYGTQASQPVILFGDNTQNNGNWVTVPNLDAVGEDVVGEEGVADADDPFNGLYPFTFPFDYGTYDTYNIQVKISGEVSAEQFKQTRLIMYVEAEDDITTN